MSVVDDIKQRLDLVELISSYLPLQKAGSNYKGLCPFHSEKTPSFVVFPETQTWHCFGACGTGGDIFGFIMRRERLEFPDALRFLAEKAGVQLFRPTPQQIEVRHEFEELWELNAAAARLYNQFLLAEPAAEHVRAYLDRRGLRPETISTFQLGYAPDNWHYIEEALTSTFGTSNLLTAGLLTKNEAGNIYDRFRNRLMFPIRDPQGHTVGFAGRVLDDSTPKYLNTPQTPVFDKGRLLYGMDLARASIRDSGQVIIVEGYMDVIIPHQCGIHNVVAVMGTSLTEGHIEALKHARDLVLALDPDTAGIRATERGYDVARLNLERQVVPVPTAEGLVRYEEKLAAVIRVLELPDGLDPDELVLSDRSRWDRLVETAAPVVDYFIAKIYAQADLASARGKSAAVDRMLQLIATVGNSVERSHYLQRVAQLFQIDVRQLSMDLERIRKVTTGKTQPARQPQPDSELHQGLRSDSPAITPQQRCLALFSLNPRLAREVIDTFQLEPDIFQDERDRQAILAIINNPSIDDEQQLCQYLNAFDSELCVHIESLLAKVRTGPPISSDSFREDVTKTVLRVKRSSLLQRILELRYAQQQACDDNESERAAELLELSNELTRALQQVDQLMYTLTYSGRRLAHSTAVHHS